MAFLLATKGLDTGFVCQLKNGVNMVGRDTRRCDVVLKHDAVSRQHARIDFLSDGVYVEDLNSRNGILINGSRMTPGIAGRRRLNPHDLVTIAPFEFVFQLEAGADTVRIASDLSERPEILSTIGVSSDSSHGFWNSSLSGETTELRARPARGRAEAEKKLAASGELSGVYRKLSAVMTIFEETNRQLDPQTAPARLLESLERIFPQTRTSCLLLPDTAGNFFAVALRNADGSKTPPRISRSVLDFVARSKQAVLSGDPDNDPVFSLSQSALGLRVSSVMCAPLIDAAERVIGIVELDTNNSRDFFTREDLQTLAGAARHLAIVIQNAGHHAAELKAQRSEFEARFRRLIEGSIHGVLIHRDFEPLFVNHAWAQLHGRSMDEVLDLESVLPLVFEADHPLVVADIGDLMAGRKTAARGERRALDTNHHPIWIEEYATVIEWEGGPAIHSTIVDLTDRKRAEQLLRESRDALEQRVRERTRELADANEQLQAEVSERVKKQDELREAETLYHSLVDHIPLCVVRKSVDGQVTFVNPALCALMGLPSEYFVGKTDHDLFSREQADQYRQADEQVMKTGRQRDFLEWLPIPSGEVRRIHTLKTPTYDAEGRLIGTQLIFWDVTEQMRTEAERNRYAAELERSNRDLEQFAYSVSHDLQSPLRTVSNYCQLLESQYGDQLQGEGQEFLSNAIDGTRRMRRLLDGLLNYSRASAGPGKKEPVNLESVLAEVLRNLDAAIRDHGAVVTHDRLPTLCGDATQLIQLLQNLINNALTHRRDLQPRVHIAVEEDEQCWRFSVQDNGEGIDARDFERIFQLFQRISNDNDRPGAGVGLSICQRVVERHGGAIHVTSKKGEGSTFHFTLLKDLGGT